MLRHVRDQSKRTQYVHMSSASARRKACDTCIMSTPGLAGRVMYKSHLLLSLPFPHTHFFFLKGRPRRTCSPPKFIRFYHMCETSQKHPRKHPMSSAPARKKACAIMIMSTLGLAGHAMYKTSSSRHVPSLLTYTSSFPKTKTRFNPNMSSSSLFQNLHNSSHVRDHPKRSPRCTDVEHFRPPKILHYSCMSAFQPSTSDI